MRVAGIDLSITATGIAKIHSSTNGTDCSVIVHGRDGLTDHTKPLEHRAQALHALAGELVDLVLFSPLDGSRAPDDIDLVLIELSPPARAAGAVWERGYLWWTVVHRLTTLGITVVDIPPTILKIYATGVHSAGKGKVIDALARRWPQFITDGDDNKVDAAVLAAMAADLLGDPLCKMPATHRRALDKVKIPAVARG